MNPTEISLLNTLLNLFLKLREFGLPLGIDDYLLMIEALQGGFGIGDRHTIEQVCCTLWTKSAEDRRLLHRLFNQVLAEVKIDLKTPSAETTPVIKESFNEPLPDIPFTEPRAKTDTSPSSEEDNTASTTNSYSQYREEEEEEIIQDPEQVVQAIRYNKSNSPIILYPSPNSSEQYLPVTARQIKQSWRVLRRPVRQGKSEELDIAATVDKISQQGILLEPIFKPRYINKTEIIILVDQGGSMTPFHHLSRQLIEKAQQGGNINKTRVYYFHNYPEEYVYSDSTRIKEQSLNNILQSLNKKVAVLIISDAGAARGNFHPERVDYTKTFLKQLQQSVRYYAWLNPVPNESWQHTTAGDIAFLVPMFEMSRQGLNAAINTLRGKYGYLDRPYQWMLS